MWIVGVAGLVVGAIMGALFGRRGLAGDARVGRGEDGGEIIVQESGKTCVVTRKTSRIHSRRKHKIVWNIRNYCTAEVLVRLADFTAGNPLTGSLEAKVGSARDAEDPTVGQINATVLDKADLKRYPYTVYVNDDAQADPDIIIDDWR